MQEYAYEIYAIYSLDHWYVGAAWGKGITSAHRFRAHLNGINSGAPLLKLAIDKYGRENFIQVVLERGVTDRPEKRERVWYDWFKTNDCRESLNMRPPGGWGGQTPESRSKISSSMVGNKNGLGNRGNRKLTDQDILEILHDDSHKQYELGQMYGVDPSRISQIKHGMFMRSR